MIELEQNIVWLLQKSVDSPEVRDILNKDYKFMLSPLDLSGCCVCMKIVEKFKVPDKTWNKEEDSNINNNISSKVENKERNNKNDSIKLIVEEEGKYQYKSSQIGLSDRENNIGPNANCVYFPAGPYRTEASHIFMNIIQPGKPLSFLPLDIFLPPLMPSERSEGAVEKYLFNIKERKLYKLIHLKVDLNNTILPFQQNSIVSLDLFKALFISFVQRVSEQNFPVREQEFFECKDPNIIIMIVRLNFNYDNSLEIYNLVNLIKCVNT
jgi:hypothetical protein